MLRRAKDPGDPDARSETPAAETDEEQMPSRPVANRSHRSSDPLNRVAHGSTRDV
jgi:hypothetical protein